jgi:hypothetical protein
MWKLSKWTLGWPTCSTIGGGTLIWIFNENKNTRSHIFVVGLKLQYNWYIKGLCLFWKQKTNEGYKLILNN